MVEREKADLVGDAVLNSFTEYRSYPNLDTSFWMNVGEVDFDNPYFEYIQMDISLEYYKAIIL